MKAKIILLPKEIYFIIISLFLFTTTEAQVIYTNLIPDSVVNTTGGVYHLDLNNDGTIDFNLNLTLSTAPQGRCSGVKINRIVRVSPVDSTLDEVANRPTGTVNYPAVISADTIINDTNFTWVRSLNQLLVNTTWACRGFKPRYSWVATTTGKWSAATDKYLGLRFTVGSNTYYGWVRLTIGTTSFTVKDYAYNSTPGQLIHAGQTSTEYLTVYPIVGSPFCPGNQLNVGYIAYGTFDPLNVFTAELSDSSGSFLNPVAIGSIQTNLSGIISATIPPGTVYGLLYRIRVSANNPVAVSTNNGVNLIVNSTQSTTHLTTNGSTNICLGRTVTISAPSGAGYTHQWSFNGVNITNATGNNYSADTIGYYQCLITNGCGTVLSDSVVVTFGPGPPAEIIAAGSLWICPGISLQLIANSGFGFNYQWYRNGSSIIGSNQQSYIALQAGRYYVQVTDSVGCVNNSIEDTVNISNPIATIVAGGATSFCVGDSVMLSMSAVSDTNFIYQWHVNNNIIPNATSPSYTVYQTGTYSLEVINPNGNCSTTSTGIDVTVSCAGVEENLQSNSNFLLSPNPASRFLVVEKKTNKKATIQIVNHFGQIIYSDKLNSTRKTIDVSKYANGIYFVNCIEEGVIETKQFTIIK